MTAQKLKSLSQLFKQNQKRNGIILGIIAVAGVAAFLIFSQSTQPVKKEAKEKAALHNVANEVEDKSMWMFKSASQLDEQHKKQDSLSQELAEIKKELKGLKTVKLEQNKEQPHTPLEPVKPVRKTNFDHTNFDDDAPQFSVPHYPAETPVIPQKPGILSINLNSYSLEEKHLPHVDSYIPAGSYARAVLLNGVDVSAGVTSQASPQPVLLKLTHKGSLPNKFFGKMKECRVIAAAYGDLSSERAYMRLETLSCVQPDGHVIETEVDGYVSSARDGKNGVRGRVVIRDAEMLKRGFMGGVLSGLGKATSHSFGSTSISPFGSVNTSTAKGADIFKQAGAQGTADAFELMARYNIQRAEQYQPVIQISANTKVEIVFHSGTKFGEQARKQKRIVNPLSNPIPANPNQEFQSLLQQQKNYP